MLLENVYIYIYICNGNIMSQSSTYWLWTANEKDMAPLPQKKSYLYKRE